MKLSYRRLEMYSILYIYIGVIIFIWGWIRLAISIPCVIFFFYLLYKKYWNTEELFFDTIDIQKKIVFGVILGIFLWLIVSGIGGFCRQSGDWDKHNAILHDLITYH